MILPKEGECEDTDLCNACWEETPTRKLKKCPCCGLLLCPDCWDDECEGVEDELQRLQS